MATSSTLFDKNEILESKINKKAITLKISSQERIPSWEKIKLPKRYEPILQPMIYELASVDEIIHMTAVAAVDAQNKKKW